MKKFLWILLNLLLISGVVAQENTKMGSKNEMSQQINELKNEIVELEKDLADAKINAPEDVQQIEQSIKMMKQALIMAEGAMKNMSSVSDKKLQQIVEEEGRLIPKKDMVRISKVPQKIVSDAEIKTSLQQLHTLIGNKIAKNQKEATEQLYNRIKLQKATNRTLSNMANSLWMVGSNEAALYLMSKACLENPSNADNLNNFSAFLSMSGAEEMALPILLKLNQQFPNNSTILNNIGQAWFGLGAIPEAEKYLDDAIRLFGNHSQANYTKCLIEQSKGNKSTALKSIKRSLNQAYGEEKVDKTNELGGEIYEKDIPWNATLPQDALSLHRFVTPSYCKNVDDAMLIGKQWEEFKDDLRVQKAKLDATAQKLEPEVKKQNIARQNTGINNVMNGKNAIPSVLPPFFAKAQLKQRLLGEELFFRKDIAEKMNAEHIQLMLQLDKLEKELKVKLGFIGAKNSEQYGEGKSNSRGMECKEQNTANSQFLETANTLLEKFNNDLLKTWMRYTNESLYYLQYMVSDNISFELAKAQAKSNFLQKLIELRHEIKIKCNAEDQPFQPLKLAEFDDINCQYMSKVTIGAATFITKCSVMTTKLEAGPFSGTYTENLNTGEFIGGTAELTLGTDLTDVELGPVKAGLEVKVGGFVEFDKNGISDFGGIVALEGGIGVDVDSSNIATSSAGGEMRVGWNSGPSINGTGVFSN